MANTHSGQVGFSRRLQRVAVVAVAAATLVIGSTIVADARFAVEIDRQLLVYEINRARWDPALFASEIGSDLGSVRPRPPLAPDDTLVASASFKADEIAGNGYFAHRSAVTGVWPNELARAFGYALPATLRNDANNLESLHSGSPVAFEVLRSFADSPTHRHHIFGEGWFAEHTEIGIGRSVERNVWAVHTAFPPDATLFVTGVVYDDRDGNGRMDAGESIAGIEVRVGAGTVITDAGGGWAIPAGPGRHEVAAAGGFDLPGPAVVDVTRWNVGVDFVVGAREPVVRSYDLCDGREPTILGTGGDDTLIGTPGPDVIHGLGGNDIIVGAGGDDILCGGAGIDVIVGLEGDDRLLGEDEIEFLDGGAGHDACDAAGFGCESPASSARV